MALCTIRGESKKPHHDMLMAILDNNKGVVKYQKEGQQYFKMHGEF